MPVALGFRVRVNPADREVGQCAVQGVGKVRRRVGGREVDGQSPARKFHGNGGRHGGFADAALAHQHDEAVAIRGNIIDQGRQVWRVQGHGEFDAGCRYRGDVPQQLAQAH